MNETGILNTDFVALALLIMKKLAVIAILAMSCNTQNEAQVLNQQLMDLHDAVMKNSSRVLTLKAKLQPLIAACTSQSHKDSLQKASAQLHIADQQMLDWMRKYQEPHMESDTAVQFFQAQIAFMNQLNIQTKQSIEQANKLINESN